VEEELLRGEALEVRVLEEAARLRAVVVLLEVREGPAWRQGGEKERRRGGESEGRRGRRRRKGMCVRRLCTLIREQACVGRLYVRENPKPTRFPSTLTCPRQHMICVML
jgi:hypothetical protein